MLAYLILSNNLFVISALLSSKKEVCCFSWSCSLYLSGGKLVFLNGLQDTKSMQAWLCLETDSILSVLWCISEQTDWLPCPFLKYQVCC